VPQQHRQRVQRAVALPSALPEQESTHELVLLQHAQQQQQEARVLQRHLLRLHLLLPLGLLLQSVPGLRQQSQQQQQQGLPAVLR
jgi:hypothetical protein